MTERIAPDPDCRLCNGHGVESRPYIVGVVSTISHCECTIVCQCGEERPGNLTFCHSPGCTNMGCDACDDVGWCCDENDEANGDWFCSECE